MIDTLHRRLPEPPPVQAQGFVILATKEVYDNENSIVWYNCRDTKNYSLEELWLLKERVEQSTGLRWRLPTEQEVTSVQKAEEYYPRPPIMVSTIVNHPLFPQSERTCWTDTRVTNVRKGDKTKTAGGVFDANRFMGGWSGYAQTIGVDAFQVAQEAEDLRRSAAAARFVRQATKDDLEHTSLEPQTGSANRG